MLEFGGMQSNPLLFPGLLWLRLVAPDKSPIYGSNINV